MTFTEASNITLVRKDELNRVNIAALENLIEEIKNRPGSSYIHDLHTKAEYLEAYKTILHETKKLRGIV